MRKDVMRFRVNGKKEIPKAKTPLLSFQEYFSVFIGQKKKSVVV